VFAWPDPFIVRAFLAAVGLAVIAAPLGCIVVWRRMSYVGETLSQAGLLGVALGLAANVNLTLAVVLAAIAAAGVLTLLGRQETVPLDSALGLMHHATLALGIAAISLVKGPGIDLMSYLFGDVFAVTWSDLAWIYVGGAAVMVATLYLWKPLVRLSLHEDLATAEGVNPRLFHAAFDLLLAVVIAVAMKIVGVLLVMAFLVVPAVAARPLSATPERMAVLAAGIAILGVILGLWLSLASDVPGGPSIVIALCTIAAISLLAVNVRGR
jgi:zinc transport system permease protein